MLFCSQTSEYTNPARSPCPGGSAGSAVMEKTGSRRKSSAEVAPCWLVWAGRCAEASAGPWIVKHMRGSLRK